MKPAKTSDRLKRTSLYKKLSRFRWFGRITDSSAYEKLLGEEQYLSHSYEYEAAGEALPEPGKGKLNTKALLISLLIALLVFFAINYVLIVLKNLNVRTIRELGWDQAFAFTNTFKIILSRRTYAVVFVLDLIFALMLYSKFSYRDESLIAYGQKGDSRLALIEEIQAQYKEVPEKALRYKGPGGIPVSHYKDKYYVEIAPYNTCLLGTTRSGKGESFIIPMIDIISRSIDKQSNMVIGDPKAEHFAAEKATLEARGYHVEVLNLVEPADSMSYNPLEGVKRAWMMGNPYEAAKRANTITYTMYNEPTAGDNKFFYEAAQNAITAIILAITEYCAKNNCPEKITMANVMDMLFELGTLNYKENPQDMFSNKNALDEYFNSLPQGHVAKRYYGSTSFAGDGKARGSILATAIKGLQPFMNTEFAKMTSMNSFPLKSIGFPKWIEGQLDSSYTGKRLKVSFHDGKSMEQLGEKRTIKVKALGVYTLNFEEMLKDGDYVLIKYEDEEKSEKIVAQISFENAPEIGLDVRGNTFAENSIVLMPTMYYRDKPTAIFMVIPDSDASNHALAAIFIKQLYTENAENCTLTSGGKCHRRIEFILDEFGQLPPIEGMNGIITVCGGRNMPFTLAIQSYYQLEEKYGKEAAKTIKENCQNHVYIASGDPDTVEEISKRVGHKTAITRSNNEEYMDINSRAQKSVDSQRLVTPERLSQFMEGEMLLLRQLHRRDNKKRKIRPFPILNTGLTEMPYRYEFLAPWMDTDNDINDIDIKSEHAMLNLEDLYIDYADFLVHEEARKKYVKQNKTEAHIRSELKEVTSEGWDDAEAEESVRNRLLQRRRIDNKEAT